MLCIGRNLMLKLVKVKGFPAVRFKRKIIINKELLPKWFESSVNTLTLGILLFLLISKYTSVINSPNLFLKGRKHLDLLKIYSCLLEQY